MQKRLQRGKAGAKPLERSSVPAGTGQTRVVTSCADDADPGTLRNLIGVAEEGDIIDLSQLTCSTIALQNGVIDMSVLGPNHLYDLTLQGPSDRTLTIDGSAGGRLFQHGGYSNGRGALNINDLSLANATATGGVATCVLSFANVNLTRTHISNCHSSTGAPANFGGAVSASGALVLVDSSITGSSSTAAGNAAALGGAAEAGYSITLINSTISGNAAIAASSGAGREFSSGGGGVSVGGPLTLINSTLSDNRVTSAGAGNGGGAVVHGSLSLRDSTIDGNSADGAGGGVFKADYTPYGDNITSFAITNTTISGNEAAAGAGMATTRSGKIENSTIAFNVATGAGGGVLFQPGGNPIAAFELQSTLIANNQGSIAGDLGTAGTLTVSGRNNLILHTDDSIALPPDTLWEDDPLLEPLANYGGATRTHGLGKGSPAIDAGNNSADLDADQRGGTYVRVHGAAADIGAFELQPEVSDVLFKDGFDGGVSITYSYDDGDGDTNNGPPSSFDPDMLWGNYFLTSPGAEVITRISVAFGPNFPSLADGPVTFWLLDDPDADFDPRNATMLTSVQATPDVVNDHFYSVDIPPTAVSRAFFVAASAKMKGGQDRPARVDTDAPGDKSWFFYAPEIGDVINDLGSAPFASRMDDVQYVVYPGAFMIRAEGIPAPTP